MARHPVCSKLVVARYVAACVRREESPRISELAQQLARSPAHLGRAFKRDYGITLATYIKAQQVRCAARLLRETRLSTARIAYLSGFGTRRTLFRAFRQRMGMSPEEYRRSMGH